MFYMESRGMNRSEIYEMMAKARLDAVIRKIPDEKTRACASESGGGVKSSPARRLRGRDSTDQKGQERWQTESNG
jgi:hypothetical protein